ncbi:hypothetical protein PR048_031153 [Dryococelus australis]|uniref:Uncharacterized protein n=1 Tax=Dryococelus australis TaxID=614101 RepID=A0ABQ9G4H1_9NEOP|nr:hypothetical protein PR048_031153 [Dryococelus australis]
MTSPERHKRRRVSLRKLDGFSFHQTFEDWMGSKISLMFDGATVAERLACSPPTKTNPGRVTGFSQVGIVPDDAVGRQVFSGISRFPRPFIPAPLHIHFYPITLIGSQDLTYYFKLDTRRDTTVQFILERAEMLKSVFVRMCDRDFMRLPHIATSAFSTHAQSACCRTIRTVRIWAGISWTVVQYPTGSFPDIRRKWESCRTSPLVGGFSRGSPISPALAFRHCSILTSRHAHRHSIFPLIAQDNTYVLDMITGLSAISHPKQILHRFAFKFPLTENDFRLLQFRRSGSAGFTRDDFAAGTPPRVPRYTVTFGGGGGEPVLPCEPGVRYFLNSSTTLAPEPRRARHTGC